MDSNDLSKGRQSIIQDEEVLVSLPPEILEIIRLGNSSEFLDAVAAASLTPKLTLKFFARFESIFADTCARWLLISRYEKVMVIGAFARILRFAPHLSVYLEKYLEPATPPPLNAERVPQDLIFPYLSNAFDDGYSDLSPVQLERLLLAALRLLIFDRRKFAQAISLVRVQDLLENQSRLIRYLAIQIRCQLLSASDAKLKELIHEYVGKDAVIGDYDGVSIDYGFLGLFEDKYVKDLGNMRQSMLGSSYHSRLFSVEVFSPFVASFGDILLPRPNGPPAKPSTLVRTITTASNMKSLAKALLANSPILIHGLSGSGKTSLINDFARELGKDSKMVTLHLNEQTDAKMLIGMYTTGSIPGSFTWQPGVLTTAIREGRWVFIEDLDRAPNEVISVILPLIETGELLIPSRGEIVRATPGFRLIASIRTSVNMSGQEIPPATHMLGARLWSRVPIKMPSQIELAEIIRMTHPILNKFLPGVIAVYDRLCILTQATTGISPGRISTGRPISPRDLLKWCRRMDSLLVDAGSKTGLEPISEKTKDEMFMEAVDCFSGSLQLAGARKSVITCIAQEMHVPPQRVEHYLDAYIPRYDESETHLQVGRAKIWKRRTSGRITKPSHRNRPFANTAHAKRLLEQVGVALKMAEPVLLVGETGIGKTTVIQQLADSLGYKLTTVNLSQQSEVGDLLGGFKPINVRSLAIPLKEEFDDLFASTGVSASKNQKYLEHLGRSVAKSQWSKASKLWREAPRMFEHIVSDIRKSENANLKGDSEQPMKRRKTESKLETLLELKPRWDRFSQNLDLFDVQLSAGPKGFAFSFVEGNIIKAARNGDWVLLDEINLASPDTLESIADLFQSGPGNPPSILLSETGEIERVWAHPDFRIFGAMNPATDVGKKDLPLGLRSRFTEIYIESPDRDLDDLLAVVRVYLKGASSNDERAAHDIARLYINTKRLADKKSLVDGANQVPHFSLRTLTRVLSYANDIAPLYGLRRALYEGYAMGFLTLLNVESERLLMPLINHHLLDSHGNPRALLSQTPRQPEDGRQYVRFINKQRDRQYWMLQGREIPQEQPHYIITPFVERNMLNLVRATSTRKFPVLVQGPTSSGKTSMIEYLAKFSGNKFVRINNHEHTDLQEYLGSYVSSSDGQLQFQEGLLVQALREGHWIVLDELNLAPSDVLEALNRLLDDNRELLIPETQEVVRPHDNFMLFATQNPPGLYGGRKTLSRAFRNRFLELHFDDIPEDELEFILEHRSQKVAPSDCRRIVTVYKELSRLRQSNRLFEQKDSFATLRDLFRWALRDAANREQLAANGYMLLAERVRKAEERVAVQEVIEKVMKVKIDPNVLYGAISSPEIQLYNGTTNRHGVVWIGAMRRLYVLVAHALRNNEPVLLVGETGCGKTTVCQMLAEAFGKKLHIVNAHQNTETGDLIGAQRPIRNRAANAEQLKIDLSTALKIQLEQENAQSDILEFLLTAYYNLSNEERGLIPDGLHQRIKTGQLRMKALFEWSDGSLIQAMKEAQFFLLDEISLADDSVLERLNSVLESQRTILLAEKGVGDSFVQAAAGFQFFATMNPGGDYGKRELSPALRNRFTEIWVPSLSDHEDILQIVEAKLSTTMRRFAKAMVNFADWFGQTYRTSAPKSISVRDMLAWITFMNGFNMSHPHSAVLHGAAMIYIDTLGANPAALLAINPNCVAEERSRCLRQLSIFLNHNIEEIYHMPVNITNTEYRLCFGDFFLDKVMAVTPDLDFAFEAPTTKLNAMRIVRAFQVRKPILIEGNPGVGKTTLITALAKAIGMALTRINLSEQTDLIDLFGSDVPVERAEAGNFAWRDAPFLQAMQNGHWVLLDEMNLASQSVLEGLNACLDHRGEVYISELDQTFRRHPNFYVFAAQNPHHQGGGRKGLPSSFVNRFSVVYADVFRNDDLTLICKHNFPRMSDGLLSNVINFVSTLEEEVVYQHKFGSQGGTWEFNLRDSLRWLQLLASSEPLLAAGRPADFLDIVFRQRFRTAKDRQEVSRVFSQAFRLDIPSRSYFHNLASDAYQVGLAYLPRHALVQKVPFPPINPITWLPELESVMICMRKNLPCILVGASGCGKTTLIKHVAAASGAELVIFPLNSDIDTMDLVGGYEQVDPHRAAGIFFHQIRSFLIDRLLTSKPTFTPPAALELLRLCNEPINLTHRLFDIHEYLTALQKMTKLPEITDFLSDCRTLLDRAAHIRTARFEWVDGVLVKALEEGKWLVLDNANLCSSSVLDRLNSLLEPNGFLSINENCEPNGEPRIVKPHSDFRLILTMDPHFGELSRAMRNRAVEIYIDKPVSHVGPRDDSNNQTLNMGASQTRYRMVMKTLERYQSHGQAELMVGVALDHLSLEDVYLLPRFNELIQSDLGKGANPGIERILYRYVKILDPENFPQLWQAIIQMYQSLEEKLHLPKSFRDAQCIHPLQNSLLVPLSQSLPGSDQMFWLSAVVELQLNILAARDAILTQTDALMVLKPSQMNRLQRSFAIDRMPVVAKDSTIHVSNFLKYLLLDLKEHLENNVFNTHLWKNHKKALCGIMHLWWETYQLATSHKFEDAVFRSHLALSEEFILSLLPREKHAGEKYSEGQEVATENGTAQDLVALVQTRFQQSFHSKFKLTTGLSMEKLWRYYRPKPILSSEMMQTLTGMEDLATRFDKLRWKVSISVPELSKVMFSLVNAYDHILSSEVDGSSLVEILSSELANLEEGRIIEGEDTMPFFSAQFEALRQFQVLHDLRSANEDIQALARASTEFPMRFLNASNAPLPHPLHSADRGIVAFSRISTAGLMHFTSASNTSLLLQSMDYLWGEGDQIYPIEDTFSAALLDKLHQMDEVDLKSLSLLETEVPLLGQHIALMSGSLCRNQLADMNELLSQMIMRIVEVHGDRISGPFKRQSELIRLSPLVDVRFDYSRIVREIGDVGTNTPAYLLEILLKHMQPATVAILAAEEDPGNLLQHSSLAWIHFAVGCIASYVPDQMFDPSIKQSLELQQYDRVRKEIQDKITALQLFENMFTGQNTNLRCQLLEEDLLELKKPEVTTRGVFRPEVSELEQLQGEFNNLLRLVLQSKPELMVSEYFVSTEEASAQSIQLLHKNVTQTIRRLSERFRAYSDLTIPVIGMLRCLQMGLGVGLLAQRKDSPSSTDMKTLSRLTPFLGGLPSQPGEDMPDNPIDSLSIIAVRADVEGLSSFDDEHRRLLFKLFHSSYEQWSRRLDADRKEAESKSGLYRFRGSAEDEDEDDQEEFNELFPTYDEESSSSINGSHIENSARNTAIALAEVHAKIFLDGDAPTKSILSLLKTASQRVGAFYEDGSVFFDGHMTKSLLPGALLKLNDQLDALSSTSVATESYNFYNDSNLPESRKLIVLIHQIQSRFRDLQNVDEIGHMQPLEDVMVSCRELLNFRHTEPLAKVITKVEKVHSIMHEWQFGGWASRANSVLTLYDGLTSTIVRWRRLELSTWARLFDMENKKCDDDAKSWWFIAYEVVIAAPLSMAQSESELRQYAQKLLQDLENYFVTAIQGQFQKRLRLLKQLECHLKMITLEFPHLLIIHKAVANFTELYTRYAKPVTQQLLKGRLILEKTMRDVLLLASWKDTNIVALRDSARRSHHKLFKLVRKYRALLGQPLDMILNQGLPEDSGEPDDSKKSVYHSFPSTPPRVDRSALTLCENHILNWATRSKRLVNISKTIHIMDDSCQLPASAMNGSQYLESFLSATLKSIADLQKATPSILTEDNKNSIKHLKTRKRKLFADTLRELRQMGIKHNLGTIALSKQESLATILSNTENVHLGGDRTLADFQYYFHKAVDCVIRARASTRQHSDDLTTAEVARSTGLLEGLLRVVLKQQNALITAIIESDKLEHTILMATGLWAPSIYTIANSRFNPTYSTLLKWLPNILRVGLELVRTHGKLGKFDTTDVQDILLSHIENFDAFAHKWQSLPLLPTGITSTSCDQLEAEINDEVQRLCVRATELGKKYPNLDFIFQQILPWTKSNSEPASTSSRSTDISIIDRDLTTTCDSILFTIEKLRTSIAKLPDSAEDTAWLVKTDGCLLDGIINLRISDINSRIGHTLKLLKLINLDGAVGPLAGAVFAAALPIFQQYLNTVKKSMFRYSMLHRATCKATYILAKSFAQIASQGFCTPSEKSNAEDGKTDKLEGGTGLGDGEGAEDISKDIQDDEDISELAQEPNKGEREEIEDEKDAVDMADDDMEGEIGEAEDKEEEERDEDSNEEDGSDDIDEEAGDVDDLDPNAIDEKMWDGEGEKEEKEQKDDQSKGKSNKDEQVAAQENTKEAAEGNGGSEEEEFGAEEGEDARQEAENHDPHTKEGEALDLPDDIELDGKDNEGSKSGSDDGMDDLSDANDDIKDDDEQVNNSKDTASVGEDVDNQEDQDIPSDLDIIDLDEDDGVGNETEEAGPKRDEDVNSDVEDQEGLLRDHSDDAMADPNEDFPSEAQGTGEDQDSNETTENSKSASKAQRDEGENGGDPLEQKETAANDGEQGRQTSSDALKDQNDVMETSTEAQPFKKLGDALEKWHRQQMKIRDAPQEKETRQEQAMDFDRDDKGFQHLKDEDAEADTQALGTATEDQAHTIDESMAIDSESKDMPETFQPDEAESDKNENDAMDTESPEDQEDQQPNDAYEGRAGAMIKQARPDREQTPDDHQVQQSADVEEGIEEVDVQLSTTHIDEVSTFTTSRSASDARQLWTHYETLTRDLSLSLTEQLRLILAPTLATKMRGDFRTGKRLNIKRIIPYIASQYKRDKIWMRRSVPSKRSYQIMLAVDDSKSMGESGSGALAFETLVMVARSLSMLEVGQMCILGFGEDVRVAHDFETPFSADAGPRVFQQFGFEQSRTDVTRLVRESMELFRAARQKASRSPADLWQLELIISDGVCDSSEHEAIRRLLREAIEERIMMVFVIVDDLRKKKGGESVMDLKEAKFVKDESTGVANVKIERYLDSFPFQYYLVVSDVKELPGVLATLLRQWFAEVADSS